MIDLHCHVLPGIDDGPATLEDSLALCREAQEAGTRTMVATPHVSWDYPDNDAARIAAACAELNAALARAAVEIEVVPGAEVALTRAADLSDEDLRSLRLGGGPWILVEPPFSAPPGAFDALLEDLHGRGHRIVLAHPERIAAFQRDRAGLERLLAMGMLTSVTAGSIGGRFGAVVQRFTLGLLRDGLVDNVASDAHGPALGRPPQLDAELRSRGWGTLVEHCCDTVPAAVLTGAPVPAPPPPRRRGLWSRLRR